MIWLKHFHLFVQRLKPTQICLEIAYDDEAEICIEYLSFKIQEYRT